MKIRPMAKEEIRQFHQLNRSEIVRQVYYFRAGKLELEDEFYDIPDWSSEDKEERIQYLEDLYDKGGVIVGAFDDELLVGVGTLGVRFMGENKTLLNLDGLWVSSTHRKQGVGSQLVDQITKIAKERGAQGLYVSATESKNTVQFYLNKGFIPTDTPDPILFDKEPRDIHMILRFEQSGIS